MIHAAQEIARRIGESGCYALCLMHVGETATGKTVDPIRIVAAAMKTPSTEMPGKMILTGDLFVNSPKNLISFSVGGKWDVRHETADYRAKPDEREIMRFERVDGAKTYSHFVVGDGLGRVLWNPLGESRTVREGKLISKRIIRKVA